MDNFEELSYYQEKYLVLWKFLNTKTEKKEKGMVPTKEEVDKVVQAFEEPLETHESEQKPK